MKIEKIDINRTNELFFASIKDFEEPVKNFVYSEIKEEAIRDLKIIQEENLNKLFNACKKFDVNYLFLHYNELAGCEDKRDEHDSPAIWTIANILGIPVSCGNTDQCQVAESKLRNLFPDNFYGYIHISENRLLSYKEYSKMKFHTVVNGRRF